MNRSQIEYILALEKFRNFGLASEHCNISQSTLSAMIAKYEDQIGFSIFNRKTRPVGITERGMKILDVLKRIDQEFGLLDEKVNEIKDLEDGIIRLACIPTVAPYLYPQILNILAREFEQVHFVVHEMTTEQIIQQTVEGAIDLGIVSTPLDHTDLLEQDLYEEAFFIYDPSNQDQSKNYKISDIDLKRLWLLEEGHCLRNQIGKICDLKQQSQLKGNLSYNCGSISTLVRMVNKNKGITLLPAMAVNQNTSIKKKSIFSIYGSTPLRKIGLVYHKSFVRNRLKDKIALLIQEKVKGTSVSNKKNSYYLDPL
ncbi:MAG: LysR substrate-binding domain-containing protein [Bacteroidota bacterium]